MGNSKSGALSKEILEELQLNTKFTEEELSTWYQSFLKECPSGRITRQEFQTIYSKFFPEADPKAYAQHVFRSFDANSDGTLDFKEYVIALHMTSAGKTNQKLEWAFSLYDVDGNGTISKNEVLEIVTVSVSLLVSGREGRGSRGIGLPLIPRGGLAGRREWTPEVGDSVALRTWSGGVSNKSILIEGQTVFLPGESP